MIGEHHSIRLDYFKGKIFPIIGLSKLVFGMPFIYALIIPIILLDAFASLYQTVCFPIYRMPKVPRSNYMQIRRTGLESLNIVDRMNCYYCSYANGVLRYVQKIAAETERMWCPIRQLQKKNYTPPPHHTDFAENGTKDVLNQYYTHYEMELESRGSDSSDSSS